MDSQWAGEHLQVIRTLMERAALYRRALAPVTTLAGTLGTAAAAAGWWLRFDSPVLFTAYWLSVGIITSLSAFLLVRQQALRQKEAFWTLPTRRVVNAMLPPLLIGLVLGVMVVVSELRAGAALTTSPETGAADLTWVPLSWILLYGCAIHAAGFFTPRGLRWFGWIFVAGGCLAFVAWLCLRPHLPEPQRAGYVLMGFFFGVLHLAYGTYLSVTERKNAA